MKHCCRNCHFLAREDVFEHGQRFTNTWTKEERKKGQITRPEELASAPKCWRGIWDTGVDPGLNSILEEIIDRDRENDGCSFIEHSEGMLFQAALELHNRRIELHAKRDEDRRHRRNFLIATIGLFTSIIALTFSIIGFEDVEKFVTQLLGG